LRISKKSSAFAARTLLRSFGARFFISNLCGFNLIGDPDVRGREFLMALTGLQFARLQEFDAAVQPGAHFHRAFARRRTDQSAMARNRRTGCGSPMQIAIARPITDAFFTEALLSFIETGLASSQQTASSRRVRSPTGRFCLTTSARTCAHWMRHGQRHHCAGPLPHPRSAASLHRSSRTVASASTCPTANTTACRLRATRPLRRSRSSDQPLLDFYAGYQVDAGANEPRVTVPLNDNIDYAGGIVTWIDNRRATGRSATISMPT